MRILLLSYYFPPDLSAGSFRAQALVEALLEAAGDYVQIDVLATEPNRYQSYQPSVGSSSCLGYRVSRVRLSPQRWGMAGQIRSFARFSFEAQRYLKRGEYDVVVATSSRLMTAVLGRWLSARLGASFYLDLRDIFVETIEDVFPRPVVAPMIATFRGLERYAIGGADRVNLVSAGFLPYFESRYPHIKFRTFTNGVDGGFDLATNGGFRVFAPNCRKLKIVYAGNIGAGQQLERVIPQLAERLGDRATISIVGDGGTRELLVRCCEELDVDVQFTGALPRTELAELYQDADVLFMHLGDLPAFERVLPSKLFEYAASGKPILAGVKGYARQFIEEEVDGAVVFDPCDVDSAVDQLNSLDLSHYDRRAFIDKYSRKRVMAAMAQDILGMGGEP